MMPAMTEEDISNTFIILTYLQIDVVILNQEQQSEIPFHLEPSHSVDLLSFVDSYLPCIPRA
jgi:hypothetical protein